MTATAENMLSDQYNKSTEGSYDELTTASEKYLCFSLDNELYGFELCSVQEIIRDLSITRIPNSAHYLVGVANLRGKVTPVIDLALKIHGSQREDHSPWIVVLEVMRGEKKSQIGIMVDELPEVVALPDSKLQGRTEQGGGTEYVVALGRTEGKVIMILDVEKLVADATGFAGDF